MWWNKDFTIKSRNDKLSIEDNWWVIEKITKLSKEDFETDLVSLQRNLDIWSEHYSTYAEIQIDHIYNNYGGQEEFQYFLSGIRRETNEEKQCRLKEFNRIKEIKEQEEKIKKEKELKNKKELLAKLKLELGESNE